jgi:hypothetical protein
MKGDASTLQEDARLLRSCRYAKVGETAWLGVSFRVRAIYSRVSPNTKTKVPRMNPLRRSFVIGSIGMGASLWLTRASADAPHLSVSDPAAKAVGYTEDASKVDKAKYPNFTAGQTCANCSLYQGKSSDAWGGCTLFEGKLVAGPGWCSSYTNM